MNRLTRALTVCVAVVLLGACNLQQSMKAAGPAIARFHQQVDAGDWRAVWDTADPGLRQATSQSQFQQLLEAVHRKLGKVRKTKQVGWAANASTGGSFVTITSETAFEHGNGTEQFVFRKQSGDGADKLGLVGYTIQSQEMMLN